MNSSSVRVEWPIVITSSDGASVGLPLFRNRHIFNFRALITCFLIS